MTTFEERLHTALRELADDTGPAPVRRWLDSTARSRDRRRARLLAAAAVAVTVVLVAASLAVLRHSRPTTVEPVTRVPHVVRLSAATPHIPGHTLLAFTLGAAGQDSRPAYVLPEGATAAVRRPAEAFSPLAGYSRPQLALDGASYLVQYDTVGGYDPHREAALAVVDLRTGRRHRLGGTTGLCPELSADGRRVAFISRGQVHLLDTRTLRRTTLAQRRVQANAVVGCAGGLGWSPDGRRLAVPARSPGQAGGTSATVIVDLDGGELATVPGRLANSSMSWSPDGSRLLTYDPASGRYLLTRVAGRAPATSGLPRPVDAVGAMGWIGSRVVWLLGGAGEQRLVTTDPGSAVARPWLRFEVGAGMTIASLQWSRDLTGTG